MLKIFTVNMSNYLSFNLRLILCLSLTIVLSSCTNNVLDYIDAYKVDETKWQLVWSDEFSVDGKPDSTKWIHSPWHPIIAEREDLVYVENGVLVLKAISETRGDSVVYIGSGIETLHKQEFLYGRVDVCAKVGSAKGSWPAIWFKPVNPNYHGGWPYCGEIDLMEHLNSDQFIYHTVHNYWTYALGNVTNPISSNTANIFPSKYNIYTLEWFPDRIEMYINGHKNFTYYKIDELGIKQWPYDTPFFLLLNQVLGGWAGEIIDSELPVHMEVDWVRYYVEK